MKIKVKKLRGALNAQPYFKAWVVGKEENYSLGTTEAEAKAFLQNAIIERPDIFNS